MENTPKNKIFLNGIYFKKMLGVKQLFKDVVIQDQTVGHYITYLKFMRGGDDMYEITVFAQNQNAPIPVWTFKLEVPYSYINRFMRLMFKMLQYWEHKIPEEDRHAGNNIISTDTK
jgi:hypothetical protein